MLTLNSNDPLAVAVVAAIQNGNIDSLRQLLLENSDLAKARIVDNKGTSRTLLHIVTDWPGHFPNGATTVGILVEAGADVNARFVGPHSETPLHWAASCDDVEVLNALIDAGADIDATGAIIVNGTPLTDARVFRQWNAAHRLVQLGAKTTLDDSAALGLVDRVENYFSGDTSPTQRDVNCAFWNACHGAQMQCAKYLLSQGAELNWVPDWEERTPLDAAIRSDATMLVQWLRQQGAESAIALNR